MHELELKFLVPAAQVDSLRSAFVAHGAQRIQLQAHYFDTAQGDLATHSVALRLRLEGRQWIQTLKARGDGLLQRLEHEVAVEGPADRVPALDVALHADTAAGQALDAALAQAGTPLVERYATDIVRLRCLLHDDSGACIEAALDVGEVTAAGRRSDLVEVELEHKGGPHAGLFDLAQRWVLHGGLMLSTLTKAGRGERLLQGTTGSHIIRASAARIGQHADGPTLMRGLLDAALVQVIGNASEVAGGNTSADAVHQLRVGLRRLRTVLRELRPLLRDVPAHWKPALADSFRRLGALRDADAMAAAVKPLLVAAGAPLLTWPADPADDAGSIVGATAFQATLVALLGLAHAADDAFVACTPAHVRKLLGRRLQKLHRQIAHSAGDFQSLERAAQHQVRKRVKRLRYLADLTADLWQAGDLRRYLKPLAAVQTALGHHMDVDVAAGAFRRAAAEQPAAWFAAGFLQAHLDVTARAGQRALRKASRAAPFWR